MDLRAFFYIHHQRFEGLRIAGDEATKLSIQHKDSGINELSQATKLALCNCPLLCGRLSVLSNEFNKVIFKFYIKINLSF